MEYNERRSVMNTNTGLTLPSNAVILNENEMRSVDGGAKVPKKITITVLIGGATYMIGFNAKTKYSKTIRRGGKKVTVSYNPNKKQVLFGKRACYIGNWLMGQSKSFNIAQGIHGFMKIK